MIILAILFLTISNAQFSNNNNNNNNTFFLNMTSKFSQPGLSDDPND